MNGSANILFIQCDSMDGRVMGCMGHPAMGRATPHLDALARQGALFRNAYTNNPICCPARAVMWSGRYAHHCEAWNNYKGLEEGDPTFRTELDAAGYVTETSGKKDYLSGRHTVRARVSAWTRSAGIDRPSYRMGPPIIRDEDTARVHEHDWENVDRCIGWLREAARSDTGPFLYYLGLGAPHPDFVTSQTYLDLIDEAGVTVPPVDEREHPVMPHRRIETNWLYGFSDEMIKTVRRIYFAMISEVDAMVGRVLDAVKELGLLDSTYVIFTSDHGELAMEHRQFYKMSMYEPSVHIPLIVAGPGVRRDVEVEAPVSLVDLYPTLMDMAGLERPGGLDGHSLVPVLVGQPSDRPDWALSEFHDTTAVTGIFMLRRGDWKYIVHVGCEPQLFNLADDPAEVSNLAGLRPDVVKEMDGLLRQIVDYEAVDAKVKEYDRSSFRQWREEQRAAGTYERTMARIYSGWDHLSDDEVQPWTAEDEERIEQWLAGEPKG